MAYRAGLALLKQSAAAVATSREGHRSLRSGRGLGQRANETYSPPEPSTPIPDLLTPTTPTPASSLGGRIRTSANGCAKASRDEGRTYATTKEERHSSQATQLARLDHQEARANEHYGRGAPVTPVRQLPARIAYEHRSGNVPDARSHP
jgi:hypothetical protein